MTDLPILDAAATRAALQPLPLLDAVLAALVAIADGSVSAPPRVAARAPGGLLGVMPAHVPGLGLAAKLVSVFHDRERPGRTRHQGVVALFDERTGELRALLDAEPLTALRTAACATAALSALARERPRRIAVVGTGVQAAAQLTLLGALDLDAEVVVGGRDAERAAETARLLPGAVAAPVREAVRGADAVLCCTAARTPVVDPDWLAPGVHLSSVGGSDGWELHPEAVARGSLFAEWAGAASAEPPAGALELQGVPAERVTLLGDVLAGRRPGRREERETTVFKSTGHAALDVAAASVAWRTLHA
ncbi:NAD(P)-binding domain-containing protein [Streptacidiphilus monticola]|uniref:NAD(P)-binding domain-containing protein n=1 Tax=Streptacidiphilus monticola TaxID=2161674 RepID=A0ABW1G274_9ACTN